MELPQSRPYGTEGGRKPTHDFLSLYSSHSTPHQDPKPSSQGGYLKTHDFLKPLERGEGNAKEEAEVEVSTGEKPPPSVEHVLPGGIGTYSISHISYFNPRAPKPEGEIFATARGSLSNGENSNGSSYSGSGFCLWEESAAKMGQTGKENAAESAIVREGVGKAAPWRTSMERASNSSTNNHRNSFSSFSSQQSLGQKSQSLMEMINSAKVGSPDEYFDDDDLLLKKESSTTTTTTTTTATTNHQGELRVKVDGKSAPDQKSNTPRSKHSATEQRRRSKINDRFQMLREIIPHGDQKRDKASFLLEVIEYIRFLQEKVHKYEGPYQGLSQEPAKPMPWQNGIRTTAECYAANQSQAVNRAPSPAYPFSSKLDEKNIAVSPTTPENVQNRVESVISPATAALVNQSMPFPVSLHPNFFTSGQNGGSAAAQLPLRLASDAEKNAFQHQPALYQAGARIANGAVSSDKLKEQELTIEGGTISISSVYSQELLNTLTKALQSCGMDLSQASISVQIELGKQASSRPKDNEIGMINQGMSHSRVSCGENSERAVKKLKTGKR